MYAIVESGGKQYKVTAGQIVDVDLLPAAPGATVELDRVLMVAGEGEVRLGSPTLGGAKVVAQVVGEVKGEKIIVFRYKPKTRYRRKTGHRQRYTRLAVQRIVLEAEVGSKTGG